MKHVRGLHEYRFASNPEERKFADAWAAQQASGHTIHYLLDPRSGQSGRPLEASDRDQAVAATVIQWLGSPVGQAFLRDLGYERKVKP